MEKEEYFDSEPLPSVESPPKIETDEALGNYYKSLLKAMADAKERAAALAGTLASLMPEASLTYISRDAVAVITFSEDIMFPKEMLLWPGTKNSQTTTPDATTKKLRSLKTVEDGRTFAESLFNVQMMETDTETVSKNLASWKIISLTQREVKIALTFAKPLEVS